MRIRFRKLTYRLFRLFLFLILKTGFNFKVETTACITTPCIFAGNHSSFLDGPITMMLSTERVHFLVDEGVKDWFLIGSVLHFMGAVFIPKNRPKRAVLKLIEVAQAGGTIGIFPEGKLTTTGELNPMGTGVIFISKKTGLPIVPFNIQGAFSAWPWGQKLPSFKPVSVHLGDLIHPETLPENADEAIDILKNKIEALSRLNR